MTRRLLAGGVVALLVAALAALSAVPAAAATGTYLRLAHLSPDTPTVDVLVTSFAGTSLRLPGVDYGDVSTYTEIEPGRYTLEMRPAGAPESAAPIVTGTLDAAEGSAYTAAGLGPRDGLAVTVLDDDLTTPGAGQARVRVVQGAEQAGAVGVRWAGAPAFDGVAFGTASDYATVPAGQGSFEITPATGPATTVPVRLDEGAIYSAVVVQRDGRLDLQLATDADGAAAAPTGGIDTGMGGTAEHPNRPRVGGALALLVVGALGLAAHRRFAHQHR
ncbi:DUF4397 domain-containing protein [Pseudonocardia oroxyli]|uniref:DUF4397 domain-containing protein n=1 Tax=Pseudonocardia oroxyli TaxID=366584 RepID=A0A1G7Y2M1_PSEOR|nr:DUF4397 domain-containing protein [Pseudonocardia oroxyli]SDG90603.1 protein of unknown function [Pseudonocardia oroxyli]